MMKYLLIALGTVSLGIGITGIFIPGLPVTPFVLLTAGLYARSSGRLYKWLIDNKYVGPYISKFQKDRGMAVRSKLIAIMIMWLMILMSVLFLLKSGTSDIIVILLGIAGSIVMGFIIPTPPNSGSRGSY